MEGKMNQRRSKRVYLALAVSAVALLGAACGGDDLSNVASGGADSDSSMDMSDMADAMPDAGDLAAVSGVSESCMEISLAMASALGAMGGNVTDTDYLANFPKAFDSIRGLAPAELSKDLDIVRDTYTAYFAILEKYDYDFMQVSANPEAIEEMSKVMDNEAFNESSERFSTWLDSVCGDQ